MKFLSLIQIEQLCWTVDGRSSLFPPHGIHIGTTPDFHATWRWDHIDGVIANILLRLSLFHVTLFLGGAVTNGLACKCWHMLRGWEGERHTLREREREREREGVSDGAEKNIRKHTYPLLSSRSLLSSWTHAHVWALSRRDGLADNKLSSRCSMIEAQFCLELP